MSTTATDQGLTFTGDALADVRAARDLACVWALEGIGQYWLPDFVADFPSLAALGTASTAIGYHLPESNPLNEREVQALCKHLTALREFYRGSSVEELGGAKESSATITRALAHLGAAA